MRRMDHDTESRHTYDCGGTNNYFNPPDQIRKVGRCVLGTTFLDLISQLQKDEVLIGLYYISRSNV